uniref:Uncharacterized protein n=1 Tax=Alexandrium catenella TaxID=2925 RepID=A0A7S1WG52_ALECA
MAPSMRALCVGAALSVASATTPQAMLQRMWASNDLSAHSEAKPVMPNSYKLRLCNAYAWSAPLEMRRVQEPKLVEYPLPYKECHDYSLPLSDGDELQFRAGDLNIGTFFVKGLPAAPAMLLLVPHRKNAQSMAVVFDSHMYTQGDYPQVALVDAFTGLKPTSLYLKEKEHREALRFNSVITLTPGDYEVSMANSTGASQVARLKALQKERYVVIRVGNAANATDKAYLEDMVVFPHSSSGANAKALGAFFAAVALFALAGLEL